MTTTTTTTTYRVKGINGDECTCACCGRNDLTKVVWLAELDADGNECEVAAYGTDCAARLMTPKGARGTARQLVNLTKALTFIAKYADSEYTLDQIRNAVAVKFNAWATVEGQTLSINTPTGWVPVLSR